MKKAIALVLICSTLVLVASPASANGETQWIDATTYIEEETGDTITLAVLEMDTAANRYTTATYRNDVLEETISIDIEDNVLMHSYADGSTVHENISDIVDVMEPIETVQDTVAENDLVLEESNLLEQVESEVALPMTSQTYLTNEPFIINPDGSQAVIPNTTVYGSFFAMCYKGNFPGYPGIYGFLSRKNSGCINTSFTNNFSISAGTKLTTAASIILALATSKGVVLVLSIIVAALSPIFEVLAYNWTLRFEVKTYRWDYRVNLGNYGGTTIFNTARTRDYLKVYRPDTGEVNYEYRGTEYDGGFMSTNSDMIQNAITFYMEDQS